MQEDYRLFVCAFCLAQVWICSRCDRGQRYCGRACSNERRQASVRHAGRVYEKTPAGRRNHARRQAAYRHRQRVNRNCQARRVPRMRRIEALRCSVALVRVTHQGTPQWRPAGMVADMRLQSLSRVTPNYSDHEVWCGFCGVPCRPFARLGFIRGRRRYGRRG